ncbi:hypothetical protein FRC17_002111 [Serendipita sp. 399]|nr:hypothetical protein FRC17_002111 [Serendipita sp. 399]
MSSVSASALALEFQALYNTGQTLPVVAELMNVTRYAHAAAVALICYDTLLTFKDEVQYIWPMKLSIIKMFIYGNRLLSFFFILIHAGPMVGLDRSFTSKYCEGIVIAAAKAKLRVRSNGFICDGELDPVSAYDGTFRTEEIV